MELFCLWKKDFIGNKMDLTKGNIVVIKKVNSVLFHEQIMYRVLQLGSLNSKIDMFLLFVFWFFFVFFSFFSQCYLFHRMLRYFVTVLKPCHISLHLKDTLSFHIIVVYFDAIFEFILSWSYRTFHQGSLNLCTKLNLSCYYKITLAILVFVLDSVNFLNLCI